MTRDLDGSLKIVVRGFGNVNVGACGCRVDLYLDALELFLCTNDTGHNDVLRISGSNCVAAGLQVQANRASRNELLLCRGIESVLSVKETRNQQDKPERETRHATP